MIGMYIKGRCEMNYYKIDLYDAATPSFITSLMSYVGTKKDINDFAKNDDTYTNSIKWEENETSEASFIPEKIELTNVKEFEFKEDKIFSHLNVWECTYNMYYKSLKGRLLYFYYNGDFYRAFCVDEIVGLSYYIEGEELKIYKDLPKDAKIIYHPLTDRVWGNKNIVCLNEDNKDKFYVENKEALTHRLKGILGYVDKVFETDEEMFEDINNPGTIKLEYFINDFFADG